MQIYIFLGLYFSGCFCVFNSANSLEFVRENLHKSVLSEYFCDKPLNARNLNIRVPKKPSKGDELVERQPFHGLPIVLVLGHEAALSVEQLRLLREDAQRLADK